MSTQRIVGTIEQRFWPKVDIGGPDECWPFTARIESNGYGIMTLDGQNNRTGAHRVSWMLAYGAIPDGLCVLHRCDNRRCVNPLHLFLGTQKDNADDMIAKGRHASQTAAARPVYGERVNTAKLTRAQVLRIRKRHAEGESLSALARTFGISHSNTSSIVRRQSWRWL